MRSLRMECFMEMAQAAARRSACLRRQVGAVLTDKDFHVLGIGYNGPPSKVEHCTTCRREGKDSGSALEDCYAIHAEVNALLQCSDIKRIQNLYVTDKPCNICFTILLNTPCQYIVYLNDYPSERGILWEKQGRRLLSYRGLKKQQLSLLTSKLETQI